MNTLELHQYLLEAIGDRSAWEARQRVWYSMRHDGLRRRNKPFKNAADLHYPLIDMSIEKFKPFFVNQVFSGERLAHFSAKRQQLEDLTEGAAEWFDYHVRFNSNFWKKLVAAVDMMLERGRGIMKVRWDRKKKQLVFESIDPVFLIVPQGGDTLEEVDCFAHVKVMTVKQYKAAGLYKADEDLLKRITGGGGDSGTDNNEQAKTQREGLTHTESKNKIVVWEAWDKQGETWVIKTFSPSAPDTELRPAFCCPLKVQGNAVLPYESFQLEIKDDGWYSPRGLAERLAPFESSLCKMWNSKHDMMEYWLKPMFESTEQMPNANNMRAQPGEVLPKGVKPAAMPQVPFTFDQEMAGTRNIASELVAAPDAGIAPQQAAEKSSSQFATAAQVNFQQALATSGIDFKGVTFRMPLGRLYAAAYALLLKHNSEDLNYFVGEQRQEMKTVTADALHDSYMISPDGAPDQWNKQVRVQRSGTMLQMFRGDPNANQDALKKEYMSSVDPRLAKKIFVPSQQASANEQEDEAIAIVLAMNHYPAPVEPGQDHLARATLILQKLQALGQIGAPVDPMAQNLLLQRLQAHVQLLRKTNPQAAAAIEQQIRNAEGETGNAENADSQAAIAANQGGAV